MWQEYLQVETEFRDSNILVGIYLEAEDFEYFRKFRKKERSTFVASAIQHYREKYPNPVFLIRCNNYVWALKRFKPELEENLIDKTKNQKLRDLNIHFPDKGKIWRYVEDFALIREESKIESIPFSFNTLPLGLIRGRKYCHFGFYFSAVPFQSV